MKEHKTSGHVHVLSFPFLFSFGRFECIYIRSHPTANQAFFIKTTSSFFKTLLSGELIVTFLLCGVLQPVHSKNIRFTQSTGCWVLLQVMPRLYLEVLRGVWYAEMSCGGWLISQKKASDPNTHTHTIMIKMCRIIKIKGPLALSF